MSKGLFFGSSRKNGYSPEATVILIASQPFGRLGCGTAWTGRGASNLSVPALEAGSLMQICNSFIYCATWSKGWQKHERPVPRRNIRLYEGDECLGSKDRTILDWRLLLCFCYSLMGESIQSLVIVLIIIHQIVTKVESMS